MSPLRSVVSSKRLCGSGTGGSSNNSVSEVEQVCARRGAGPACQRRAPGQNQISVPIDDRNQLIEGLSNAGGKLGRGHVHINASETC